MRYTQRQLKAVRRKREKNKEKRASRLEAFSWLREANERQQQWEYNRNLTLAALVTAH